MTLLKKEECCGCGTCYHVCPTSCIKMQCDSEGFLYPEINKEKCIDCGKCKKRCPVLNKKETTEINKPITYAAYSKQDEIRNSSSSGGVFSHIANFVLEKDGIVFGVGYGESNYVRHMYIDKKEELWKIRGSKYVQSDVGDSYKQAEEFLIKGKWVLYTGTPCQISGLYHYLEKTYDKLITQDIICHGTMSPVVYEKYISYLERRYNSQIDNISFRDKTYGWNQFSMAVRFKNGKKYIRKLNRDYLMRAYLKNACLRPTCYNCQFKDISRKADITLADFWNIQEIEPEIDFKQGVSLVLLHSSKAKEIFEKIKESVVYKEVCFDDAIKNNMPMIASVPEHPKRKEFMDDIKAGKKISNIVKRYCREDRIMRIYRAVASRLFKKKKK